MSGDALTTAVSTIGQFSPERGHAYRKGVHALTRECQDEIGAVNPGHLRRAFLGHQAARIPVNRSGKAQIACHFVG